MNKRLIHVAVALAAFPVALLAQDSPSQPTPSFGAAAAESDQLEGAGVIGEKGKETLSVDFPNAEIRTILRNIADLFDLNLVIPETLEGRASLKLREVTWRQIFDVLLSPIGYTYVADGNIIKVVSIESLDVEPSETRIYVLNYARAADIAVTVNSMLDPTKGGKLQVEARSNALVVTERPKRHEQIREIIQRLDRATEQVMIETKFVEVTDRDVKNLGVNWSSLANFSVGTEGRITSQAASVDSFGSPPQTNASGVVTSYGAPQTLAENATARHLGDAITRPFKAPQIVTSTFSADEFRVVLSALQTLSGTQLVSNPTVVTLNNTQAEISIGRQFPVPKYSYNNERGTFEVSDFEYKDIGIIMKVTPQVNATGLITMKIEPEVSSQDGTTTFGGASGAEIPIISTRRTSTQVALKDGYTMGLGGLIETTNVTGQTKVPLLGDIPVLGRMFRSNNRENNKRNLIIFITAKILPAEEATYSDVFTLSKMEKMGVSEDDVPRAPGHEQ